jgi:Insect allergen related repeat, nitrile-specifier detoxification
VAQAEQVIRRREENDPLLRKTMEYLRSPVFQEHLIELNQLPDVEYVKGRLHGLHYGYEQLLKYLTNMNGQQRYNYYSPPERPIPTAPMMGLVNELLSILDKRELQKFYSSHKVENFLKDLSSKDVKEALQRLNENYQCKDIMERFKYHGFDPRTIMTKFYLYIMKIVKE